MTVRDVCAAIEEWAPAGLAYPWDRSGLRIGRPDTAVTGVLVALGLSRASWDAARAAGANLVVTHHPPMWEPCSALRTDDPEVRLWVEVAAAGAACYACHTPLDLAPGGVNSLLAGALSLGSLAPLLPADHAGLCKLVTFVPESHLAAVRDAVCRAGAGVIGNYAFCTFSGAGEGTFLPGAGAIPFVGEAGRLNAESERRFEVVLPAARAARVVEALRSAHPYEEPAYDLVPLANTDQRVGLGVRGALERPVALLAFAQLVRQALGVSHVRLVGDSTREVRTVGVLGGAGGSHVGDVAGQVDVLVTGDVGYHDALTAAAAGLAVVDAGHAGTEGLLVPALARYLCERIPAVPVTAWEEPELFRAVLE